MSLISSDGLSLDAPGTGWKSVGVDPLVVWSLATLAAGNSLEFLVKFVLQADFSGRGPDCSLEVKNNLLNSYFRKLNIGSLLK